MKKNRVLFGNNCILCLIMLRKKQVFLFHVFMIKKNNMGGVVFTFCELVDEFDSLIRTIKREKTSSAVLRFWSNAQGYFCQDAELSFGPEKSSDGFTAGVQFLDGAVWFSHPDSEDGFVHASVGKTVQPHTTSGNPSGNGGKSAGRCCRRDKAVGLKFCRHIRPPGSWLHTNGQFLKVNLEDGHHPGHIHDDPVPSGNGSSKGE